MCKDDKNYYRVMGMFFFCIGFIIPPCFLITIWSVYKLHRKDENKKSFKEIFEKIKNKKI